MYMYVGAHLCIKSLRARIRGICSTPRFYDCWGPNLTSDPNGYAGNDPRILDPSL